MQPSSLPLTLTLSLKGRGVFIVFLLVLCSVMLGASLVSAETWRCRKPDGSVVYSDQNLSGECRKLEGLPPLLRVASVAPGPGEGAKPEAAKPAPPEAAQVAAPRRGPRDRPPSEA